MRKFVLITGASSGIGESLMVEFMKNGYPIVAVARDRAKLQNVVDKYNSVYPVEIIPIAKDLTNENSPQEIYDELKEKEIEIEILVNNAGVGFGGLFAEIPIEKMIEIIRLDVEALTRMTRLFLPDMIKRDNGKILNVSSIAGFEPGPLMAIYHAAKAFVLSLSEALIEELDETNVTVTCLAPGPVDTDFFRRADLLESRVAHSDMLMLPEQVASEAYEGLMQGQRVVMPGAMNKVMIFSRRIMSLGMQAKLQKNFYERSEEE